MSSAVPFATNPDNPLAYLINYFRTVKQGQQESITVPYWKSVAGEYPPVTFPQLRDYYTQDGKAYAAVNLLAGRALSRGGHILCNPDAPGAQEAEDFIDDWLNYVRWGDRKKERGWKPLSRIIMRELCWAGASGLEQIGIYNDSKECVHLQAFAQLQVSSIWRYQRDDTGQLKAIWQWPSVNPYPLTPSRYIFFDWNVVDRNPFGYGLLHPVAQWRVGIKGNLIPPMMLIKWQIEDDMRRRIHRYGSPRAIYQFEGMSENEVKPYNEELKDPEADVSFATNSKVDISMDSPTGRINFGPDLDYLDDQVDISLGNPLATLLAADKGMAYASSYTAADLATTIVYDLQEVYAHTLDTEIIGPVLEQNGYGDPMILKPHWEFNIPEKPDAWTVADVITAWRPDPTTGKQLLSTQEARTILADFAQYSISPDKDPNKVDSTGQVQAPAPAQEKIEKMLMRAKKSA
ncbi:MAG: phage portal protein family protein [Nitrososphaerales archaeon]